MIEPKAPHVFLVGLLVLALLVSFQTWKLMVVGSQIDLILATSTQAPNREDTMQTIEETATRIRDGKTAIIKTPRRVNEDGTDESLNDWMNRHGDAVEAFENS